MFCSNCGNQVAEGASFCANCGNAVMTEAVAPVVETPVAEPVAVEAPVVEAPVAEAIPVATPVAEPVQAPVPEAQNVYNAPTYNSAPTFSAAPVENVDAGSLMIKGILAIALCEFGIPGIILGSMAKKLAAQFMAANGGQIFGKAKVGSILGRLGFGFGIGFTVFWGLYFLIFVGLLGSM